MEHPDIAQPSAELIERIASLATSTLANALDDVGLHDRVIAGIKAVAPGSPANSPARSESCSRASAPALPAPSTASPIAISNGRR